MTTRVNHGAWLLKLIAWDGLLPAIVILVPLVARQIAAQRAVEFLAIALPIAAFLLRLFAGRRHIDSNQCSPLFRRVQFIFFYIAIFVLLMIDSLMILAHEMPPGAMFASAVDFLIWAVLFALYLTCMAVAMYPGRTEHLVESREYDPMTASDEWPGGTV